MGPISFSTGARWDGRMIVTNLELEWTLMAVLSSRSPTTGFHPEIVTPQFLAFVDQVLPIIQPIAVHNLWF